MLVVFSEHYFVLKLQWYTRFVEKMIFTVLIFTSCCKVLIFNGYRLYSLFYYMHYLHFLLWQKMALDTWGFYMILRFTSCTAF